MMKHLSILTGIANPTKKLIRNYWSMSAPKCASINVFTDKVYNMIEGYSLDAIETRSPGGVRYTATVKISNELIIRYTNLKELYLPDRSCIESGFLIGKADKYVGIECCTRVRSQYPVRIEDRTYYREDPADVLFEDYEPDIATRTFYQIVSYHFEFVEDFDEDR